MATIRVASALLVALGIAGTALGGPAAGGVTCVVQNAIRGTSMGCAFDDPTDNAAWLAGCLTTLGMDECSPSSDVLLPRMSEPAAVLDCADGGSRAFMSGVTGGPTMGFVCRL